MKILIIKENLDQLYICRIRRMCSFWTGNFRIIQLGKVEELYIFLGFQQKKFYFKTWNLKEIQLLEREVRVMEMKLSLLFLINVIFRIILLVLDLVFVWKKFKICKWKMLILKSKMVKRVVPYIFHKAPNPFWRIRILLRISPRKREVLFI